MFLALVSVLAASSALAGGGGSGPEEPCDWQRKAKIGECRSVSSFSDKGEKDKIEFYLYDVVQEPGWPTCDEVGRHVVGYLRVYVERDGWSWDMGTDPVQKGRSGLPVIVDAPAWPPNSMRKFHIHSFGVTNARGTKAQLKADAYREKSGYDNRGKYDLVHRLDREYDCHWAY